LYNLKDDLSEVNDLSEKYPQKVKEMEKLLMGYVEEVNAEAYISGVAPKKVVKDDID
jgi:hypothetical protein